MHLLKGLEYAYQRLEDGKLHWKKSYEVLSEQEDLPKPINTATSPLFFGAPSEDGKSWKMKYLSCRTNFQPTLKGSLNEIVVSGLSAFANDPESVMTDRSDKDYEHGWLVDVGPTEKKTKRKVMALGGLGYIDMKVSLYGKANSGPLHLFLPYEKEIGQDSTLEAVGATAIKKARDWIPSIVLCEVNENRGNKECDMDKDLSIYVGGAEAQVKMIPEINYLKKEICIDIEVPSDAKMSTRAETYESLSIPLDSNGDKDDLGLELQISVTNPEINHSDGACSIAHIVWESIPKSTT